MIYFKQRYLYKELPTDNDGKKFVIDKFEQKD